MKFIKYSWLLLVALCTSMQSCTDLDEQVYDRIDASVYYQDETSVKGAVSSIYYTAAMSYVEYFWYLQEFSATK